MSNKSYCFLIIICSLLSSCFVIHRGNVSSGPLLNINDRYVDIAKGEAKSLYVWGFGDLKNDVLLLDAKKRLFSNRPLNKNEYYANFTSTISQKFIVGFLVVIHKVTVSAEVLKTGVDPSDAAKLNAKDTAKIFNAIIGTNNYFRSYSDTFRVEDEVYYNFDNDNLKSLKKYKITSIFKDKVGLKPYGLGEEAELVSRKHKFYSASKSVKDFKIGDKVKLEYNGNLGSQFIEGFIIATGNGYALVQTNSGVYEAPPTRLEHLK